METDNLQPEHHEVIGQLASCPATSFHEYLVSDKIKNILVKSEIEFIEQDSIVITCKLHLTFSVSNHQPDAQHPSMKFRY